MGQLIVRDLEDQVKAKLKRRAQRHGRSMEEEARAILRDAVKSEGVSTVGLGTRISARFAGLGLDTDIKELRGFEVRPATFDDVPRRHKAPRKK